MALTFSKDNVTLVYDGEQLVAMYRQNSHLRLYATEELTEAKFDKITGADKPAKAV